MRSRWRRTVAALAIALPASCTFTDLAGYAVPECNPAAVDQAHDDCDHLNRAAPSSCTPWQCDATTRHCVQQSRDDDKDGDPSRACGGRDCDDQDPTVNGLRTGPLSVLAQLDAATIIDDKISLRGGARPSASFVTPAPNGACIDILALATQPTAHVLPSCTLLGGDTTLAPTQLSFQTTPSLSVASFVVTSDCPTGRLGFASGSASGQGEATGSCDAGALHPTIELLGSDAVVAYYAAPFDSTDASRCPPPTAPLYARRVVGAAEPTPSLSAPILFVPSAFVASAPGLIVSADQRAIVVTAASTDGVHVWLLDATLQTRAHLVLDALAGATGVTLGGHELSGSLRLAVVSQRECGRAPMQLERIDADLSSWLLSRAGSAIVTEGLLDEPSIAWSDKRAAWLVTWYASTSPTGIGARYFDDGARPLTDARVADADAADAVPDSDGAAWLIRTRGGDAIMRAPLQCP